MKDFIYKNLLFLFVFLFVFLFITSCVPDPLDNTGAGEIIGVAGVELNLTEDFIRNQEAPIGNLIADAMIEYLRTDTLAQLRLNSHYGVSEIKLDFAMVNAGGIGYKDLIPNGIIKAGSDITTGMVDQIIKYDNNLAVVRVPGSLIKEIFEHAFAKVDESAGQFMQYSKEVSVTVNKTEEPEIISTDNDNNEIITQSGKRVKSIKINGVEVDPLSTYFIVTTDYIVGGGDKYITFNNLNDSSKLTLQNELGQVLKTYITAHRDVSPVTSDRIVYEK